jgi:hypothetical protein
MGQTWLNRRINGPSAVGGEGDKGDPTKKAKRQARRDGRRDGRNDHNTPEKINYRKPETDVSTDDWKTQAEWDQVSKAELENLNPISKLRHLVRTKYFFKIK